MRKTLYVIPPFIIDMLLAFTRDSLCVIHITKPNVR